MAQESEAQRKTTARVMHEFKHGELESSRGGKVKSRRQAIAIALSEAGASRDQSPQQKRRALRRTKAKETRGETAMQEKEGRRAVTRGQLEEEARARNIPGRSRMSKAELARALSQT